MASNLSTTHAEEENDQVLGAKICSLLLDLTTSTGSENLKPFIRSNHQSWESGMDLNV